MTIHKEKIKTTKLKLKSAKINTVILYIKAFN